MKFGIYYFKRNIINHYLCGLLFAFFVICPFVLDAQEKLTPFINKVEGGYNFWLHEPDMKVAPNQPIPLLLFLHGKSLSGSNMEMVKRYGVL